MNDQELRLECVRIASENLRSSTGQALEAEVRDYAEKLFKYIWNGEGMKEAA